MKKTPIRDALMVACSITVTLYAQAVQKPAMGWNSYNRFGNTINEATTKQIADAMVSSGMRDAGYTILVVDCNWQANPPRDVSGNLLANPTKFPGGMKALADYVHGKGLKIGLHANRGPTACESPTGSGSGGHEQQDARTWASWGIDFIKYDNCNATDTKQSGLTEYALMRDALQSSGRDFKYSLCCWGKYAVQEWGSSTGNSWRVCPDIKDSFDSTVAWWGRNMMAVYDYTITLADFAGEGRYNDPDMLEVGCNGADNGGIGMSLEEYHAHFSLWALMAAPLMAGNDVRSMSTDIKNILCAPEIIAVDQDPDGIQGRRVSKNGNSEIIARELSDGSVAVGLLNRGTSSANITVNWATTGLLPGQAQVRNLWTRTDLGAFTDSYTASVARHGIVVLKIRQTPPAPPVATSYLSDMTPSFSRTGGGAVQKDKSSSGNTLTINSSTFTKGLGTNADSDIRYFLNGKFGRFTAEVGVDDEVGRNGSVKFIVYGDSVKLYDSGKMTGDSAAKKIDINVSGVVYLKLYVRIAPDITNFPAIPLGYTRCANENQSYTLPGKCDVAFGANGVYSYLYGQTGTIAFNSTTFSYDPIPGTVKAGYYKLSGSTEHADWANASVTIAPAAVSNSGVAQVAPGLVVQRVMPDGVAFVISKAVNHRIDIVALSGRIIRTFSGDKAARYVLSSGAVAPGVYLVRARVGSALQTSRIAIE
jgi:alpha-galactosidase